MFTGPRAHFDHVGEKQRGILLKLCDVHPPDYQLGWAQGTRLVNIWLLKTP